MLPPEILVQVCEDFSLEDVVSLGLSSDRWVIPESVYQRLLVDRCPSFSPETSPRESWKECARVHVARLNCARKMKYPVTPVDPILFNLSGIDEPILFNLSSRVEPISVIKNTPVSDNFESLMDGYERRSDGQFLRPVMDGDYFLLNFWHLRWFPCQYLRGNAIKFCDTVVYLGSDQGTEPTPSRLVTAAGIELELPPETRTISESLTMSHTSIGFTSTRFNTIDKTWNTFMAFKLGTSGRSADVVKTMRSPSEYPPCVYPFINGDKGHLIHSLHRRSCSHPPYKVSFEEAQNGKMVERQKSYIYMNHDHGIIWFDGLMVAHDFVRFIDPETNPGTSWDVYFYDMDEGIAGGFQHTVQDTGDIRISENRRYAVAFDENGCVGRVWDLWTNTQYFVSEKDRRGISTVGLVNGELVIHTFDGKFAREHSVHYGESKVDFGKLFKYSWWEYFRRDRKPFDMFDPPPPSRLQLWENFLRQHVLYCPLDVLQLVLKLVCGLLLLLSMLCLITVVVWTFRDVYPE